MPHTESFSRSGYEIPPPKTMESGPAVPTLGNRPDGSHQRKRSGKLFSRLGHFFGRDKNGLDGSLEEYMELAQRFPENAAYQLKLAEIYQKKGAEEKAIAKYLQAAEVFGHDNFFPQAMAIYKQVLSLNPHLIHANQKMGEIYREMGYLSEAITQYKIVAKHYETWGRKERIPQIQAQIRELEAEKSAREKKAPAPVETKKAPEAKGDVVPQPRLKPVSPPKAIRPAPSPRENNENLFDLSAELAAGHPGDLKDVKEISTDKLFGFEEIFKELQETVIPAELYPNFNYHMGKACREMGFNDGAIEQLQIAMQNGQKPVDAARLLSKCFREKGWFHEAQKYFEKAMQMESDTRKRTPSFKSELVMNQS
jgi:tetratricopeptide (TPR) repeat protein